MENTIKLTAVDVNAIDRMLMSKITMRESMYRMNVYNNVRDGINYIGAKLSYEGAIETFKFYEDILRQKYDRKLIDKVIYHLFNIRYREQHIITNVLKFKGKDIMDILEK